MHTGSPYFPRCKGNMADGELEIPESNREIALHLRAINNRLSELETTVNEFQESMEKRRYRLQDVFLGGLILPIIGGTILYLLTQTIGI